MDAVVSLSASELKRLRDTEARFNALNSDLQGILGLLLEVFDRLDLVDFFTGDKMPSKMMLAHKLGKVIMSGGIEDVATLFTAEKVESIKRLLEYGKQ